MASLSRYIGRRLVQGVITIFVVTIIVFLLFRAMPGSPIDRFRSDPTFSQARLQQLSEQFGINDPPFVALFKYLRNMFTLDFGPSFLEARPVRDIIADAAPRTLFLFGGATMLEYAVGVFVGRYIAWKRGRVSESAAIVSSLFFYNMPSFWIGLILLWVFAFSTDWFPLRSFSDTQWTASHFPGTLFDPGSIPFKLADLLMHAALPMLALVLITAAGTILLMQTSMLEVMGEDFILTARAKGLPERIVRRRHAARNAYLPVVTSFTIALAFSIGGAIILEQIFSYFGLGYYLLQAILNQDHFLAGAILFILSVLVIFANIIADILYGVLDPRVRI